VGESSPQPLARRRKARTAGTEYRGIFQDILGCVVLDVGYYCRSRNPEEVS
jgi:hypothetical protein